jgi:hypothetical protein
MILLLSSGGSWSWVGRYRSPEHDAEELPGVHRVFVDIEFAVTHHPQNGRGLNQA